MNEANLDGENSTKLFLGSFIATDRNLIRFNCFYRHLLIISLAIFLTCTPEGRPNSMAPSKRFSSAKSRDENDRLSPAEYLKFFSEKDTLLSMRMDTISNDYTVLLELYPCYPVENSSLGLECAGSVNVQLFEKGKSKAFQVISRDAAVWGLQAADSTFNELFFDESMSRNFLRFTDLNNDDHDDMIIKNPAIGYSVYIYSQSSKILIYDSILSDILRFSSSCNVDELSDTLVVHHSNEMAIFYCNERKYSLSQEPTLVKEFRRIENQNAYYEINRKLVNGKWIESVKKSEPDHEAHTVNFIGEFEITDGPVEFRILAGVSYCEIKYDQSIDEVEITIKLITKEGEVFQNFKTVINRNGCDLEGYIKAKKINYEEQTLINFTDFNQDGIDDITILNGGSGNYGAPTRDAYLYSTDGNKFIFNFALTDLWSHAFELTVDGDITHIYYSGGVYFQGSMSFKFVNDRPILIHYYSRHFTHHFSWSYESTWDNDQWVSGFRREAD